MPSRPDCESCEFRDRPEVCHALATGHRPFCRPRWRAYVRARTLGEPAPPRPASEQPAGRPVVAPAADARRLRLHGRMLGCRHRRPLPDRCIDCEGTCSRDANRGPVRVLAADCRACDLIAEPEAVDPGLAPGSQPERIHDGRAGQSDAGQVDAQEPLPG